MKITVKTVSRLHLGFLDLCGDLGRTYGSVGVALQSPRTVVTATQADELIVENGNSEDILRLVDQFSRFYQVRPAARIRLLNSIPRHSGLGSGTQLTLAIAAALAKLCEIDVDPYTFSCVMERGRRSGIGIACFDAGGFIIDSGRKNTSKEAFFSPPKVIFRHEFPPDWCFVLVIPETGKGLSGDEEEQAMNCLTASRKISEEICRLIQIKLLPALIEREIEDFGAALTGIDRRTGMFFKKVQKGIYRGDAGTPLVDCLLRSGAYGAGQSSWGPTIYGLVDDARAEKVVAEARAFLTRKNMRGTAFITHADNTGAEISINEGQLVDRGKGLESYRGSKFEHSPYLLDTIPGGS